MGSYPTIYLRGMREIDKDFEKMLAVRDACHLAGVEIPDEVVEYFGSAYEEGRQELLTQKFSVNIVSVDGGSGEINEYASNLDLVSNINKQESWITIDIDLKKLPTSLQTIQLEMSW
jgi:hypothetical protein